MSSKIQMVGLVLLGSLLAFLVFIYFVTFADKRDLNTLLLSDVKTELYNDRDDSARLTKGSFYIQKSDFESDLKALFVKQMNASSSDVNMTFSYEADSNNDDNSIAGVKVTTTYKGQTYYTKVLVSKGEWQTVSPNNQSANNKFN